MLFVYGVVTFERKRTLYKMFFFKLFIFIQVNYVNMWHVHFKL